MSLPPELKEPIDDIKTPSNRVLVTCLILAVMALAGVVAWLYKNNNNDARYWKADAIKAHQIIDSLKDDKVKTVTEENKRLKERDKWQDSIKSKIYNKLQ